MNFALQIAYVHELLFEKNKSLDDRSIASILKPQRPGNELANAIVEELSQKVQRAESQGFRWYGADPDRAKTLIEIPARKMYSLTINCTQGDSYLIFAVSRGAPDVDLTVVTGSGTIVASDTKDDAEPVVMFTARTSGKYAIVTTNPSSSSAVAVVAAFEK